MLRPAVEDDVTDHAVEGRSDDDVSVSGGVLVAVDVDMAPAEGLQLAEAQSREAREEHHETVLRTNGIGKGVHLGDGGDRRSSGRSRPAPSMSHGLAAMIPSVTAVPQMVRSSRYVLAAVDAPG